MKDKRGVSAVIIAVLLILLTLTVASTVFIYSKNLLRNVQKDSATALAQTECPKKFSMQIDGCFNLASNQIHMDIVNLKDEIPAGSLISLESDYTKVLMQLYSYPPKILGAGQSDSITINASEIGLNLAAFGLKKIGIVPIFMVKDARVLCDELGTIDIAECK